MILGVGIALGIFGFVSLILTGCLMTSGELKSLTKFDYQISVFSSALRNTLLIIAGIMAYYAPDVSGIFVWGALCVFVLSATMIIYRGKKKVALSDFVPSFYYTCFGLLVGAIILS